VGRLAASLTRKAAAAGPVPTLAERFIAPPPLPRVPALPNYRACRMPTAAAVAASCSPFLSLLPLALE
jgi:hypothetical protein